MITAGRLPQWSLLRIGTPPLSHFVGKHRNTKERQQILKQQTAPQNRHTAAVTLRGGLQKENLRKTQKALGTPLFYASGMEEDVANSKLRQNFVNGPKL